MTSTLSTGPGQWRLDGCTVRDIVEHDPAQVNEVWCRNLFRQLLRSLERQYALRLPRQAITPDTVVFDGNGEPRLLPTPLADAAPDEAADLAALARVVHFAITSELVPAGPLRGRRLHGYSDSLLGAVDRCMAADPAGRPHHIAELRLALGIVALEAAPPSSETKAAHPPGAARLPAAPATTAAPRPSAFAQARWQRRAIAAGGGAALLALALALYAELRDAGSYDHILLTLPQPGEPAQPGLRAPEAGPEPAPAAAPVAAPASPTASAAVSVTASPRGPAAAGVTYKLLIQPWGVVYVDGVEHGVSPPLKRLVLAPGRHLLRIANPHFRDRVLEVDTGGGGGRVAVDFSGQAR